MAFQINPFTGKFDKVSIADLSGFVPYTGATSNVDLGAYDLTTTGTLTAADFTVTDPSVINCGNSESDVPLSVYGNKTGEALQLRLGYYPAGNGAINIGGFSAVHYINGEEDVAGLYYVGTATGNIFAWGGGVNTHNAARFHRFYTAADDTTLTGTMRLQIDGSGTVSLPADNARLAFGAGEDASIYFDGTNFIIEGDNSGQIQLINTPEVYSNTALLNINDSVLISGTGSSVEATYFYSIGDSNGLEMDDGVINLDGSYLSLNGNYITDTLGDILFKAVENTGATSLIYQDSDSTERFSVDSDGFTKVSMPSTSIETAEVSILGGAITIPELVLTASTASVLGSIKDVLYIRGSGSTSQIIFTNSDATATGFLTYTTATDILSFGSFASVDINASVPFNVYDEINVYRSSGNGNLTAEGYTELGTALDVSSPPFPSSDPQLIVHSATDGGDPIEAQILIEFPELNVGAGDTGVALSTTWIDSKPVYYFKNGYIGGDTQFDNVNIINNGEINVLSLSGNADLLIYNSSASHGIDLTIGQAGDGSTLNVEGTVNIEENLNLSNGIVDITNTSDSNGIDAFTIYHNRTSGFTNGQNINLLSYTVGNSGEQDFFKMLGKATNSADAEVTFQLRLAGTLKEFFQIDGANQRVDVNGLSENIDFRVLSDDGTNLIKCDASTNRVGIGVSAPTEFLHVAGNVYLSTDNYKLLLGTGKDASIYYDGTDLAIDSAEVGSGTIDLVSQSASAITTETLSEYITIKIGGVSKKIAIVA